MKTITKLIILLVMISGACSTPEPRDYFATETLQEKEARMQWWRDAKFGMFIHWGGYSHLGGMYKGDTISGIAEWLQYYEKIPADEYAGLIKGFNPVKFNAKDWAELANNAGMKYLVITSKHHEGFAMWDSKVTDFDIVDFTPYGQDVLIPLSKACRKEGIKFCTYHSILDWHYPKAKGDSFYLYRDDILKPQLKEIIDELNPAVMWFDGEWINEWTEEQGIDLYNYLRNLSPELIINNRVGKGRDGMQGMSKEGRYVGDFGTPEQEILEESSALDWESCMTMNDTWGYKIGDDNWKSAQTLIHNLIDVVAKGGNYLLNVGPTGEGLIPQESIDRLLEIGQWIDVNGEAIYNTKRAEYFKEGEHIRYTSSKTNQRLYALSLEWPGIEIKLKHFKADKNSKVNLLGYSKALKWYNDPEEGFIIQIPEELQREENRPCKYAYVFTFSGTANQPTSIPDIIANDKTNPEKLLFTNDLTIELIEANPGDEIYFTTDGSDPTTESYYYTGPITCKKSCTIKAFSSSSGHINSLVRSVEIQKTKGINDISIKNKPSMKYCANGALSLVDKNRGSDNFSDGNWLGFEGIDFETEIDLGEVKKVNNVSVGFMRQSGAWIFYPVLTKVSISIDGNNFTEIASLEKQINKNQEKSIEDFKFSINKKTRYIKIHAKNMGNCPSWHAGAGGKAWIFVDEIIIK